MSTLAHLPSIDAVFARLVDSVAVYERSGRIVYFNPTTEQLFGLRTADAAGRIVWQLFPAARGNTFHQLFEEVARDGRTRSFEHYYGPWDCWYDNTIYGVGEHVVVWGRDITQLKRDAERLQQLDRAKDEFLAMLAHELRNPLAPIGAAAHLLATGRLDAERIAHISQVISRQVKHMTGLVNDLLDVSRVTRGIATLEMAPLDAREVVADAIDQVRPLMEARRHVLHVPSMPEAIGLVGDPKRLVQVLVNLLNNAAKFTPEAGWVRLQMEVEGGELRLMVSDNGIGMEPALVERAFELFVQAERTADRSQGGLGIGLALVKSLVELHGGRVTGHSAGPGRGSTFTVCLPLPAQHGHATRFGDEQTQAPGPGLRLLVVDDNVDAASLLGMLLEQMGHQVIVEHDPVRALQRAVEARPQACLLDIGLPEMDGNELARRLRRLPETAGALLIAITGYGQCRDRDLSAAAGFDHHLMKPVDAGQLAAVLASIQLPAGP